MKIGFDHTNKMKLRTSGIQFSPPTFPKYPKLTQIRRPLVVRVRPLRGEGLPSPLPLSQGHFFGPAQKSRNVSRIWHISQSARALVSATDPVHDIF